MSKAGTQYSEDVREMTAQNAAVFGLNPFALDLLIKSYKQQGRAPFKATIEMTVKDKKKVGNIIDIYIITPGFLGKKRADPRKIDQTALRLFVQSYYHELYPLPSSFLYGGVEIHLRSKTMEEFRQKNPLREIYDPTK